VTPLVSALQLTRSVSSAAASVVRNTFNVTTLVVKYLSVVWNTFNVTTLVVKYLSVVWNTFNVTTLVVKDLSVVCCSLICRLYFVSLLF